MWYGYWCQIISLINILVVMEHSGKLVKIIIDKFFMKYWNSTRVYT